MNRNFAPIYRVLVVVAAALWGLGGSLLVLLGLLGFTPLLLVSGVLLLALAALFLFIAIRRRPPRSIHALGALAASALAALAAFFLVPDYRDTPEHMYSVLVTGELKRLAGAQAAYYAAQGHYTGTLDSLEDWIRREYIALRIEVIGSTAWRATATYAPLSIHCELQVSSPSDPLPTFQDIARECVLD